MKAGNAVEKEILKVAMGEITTDAARPSKKSPGVEVNGKDVNGKDVSAAVRQMRSLPTQVQCSDGDRPSVT